MAKKKLEAHGGQTHLAELRRIEDASGIAIRRYRNEDLVCEFTAKLMVLSTACFPNATPESRNFTIMFSDVIYVATKMPGGEIVAMMGAGAPFELRDRAYSYWPLVAVAESERGRGLFQRLAYHGIMNGLAIGTTGIILDTQNANVEYAITRSISRIIDEGHLQGYEINRKVRPKYFKNGPIAGAAPLVSRSREINAEYAILNTDRGDAFKLEILLMPKRA
jgi:hypothetical protein